MDKFFKVLCFSSVLFFCLLFVVAFTGWCNSQSYKRYKIKKEQRELISLCTVGIK